jgi:adenosine 3'-phospho 5'-phosphosulfate transporter B2
MALLAVPKAEAETEQEASSEELSDINSNGCDDSMASTVACQLPSSQGGGVQVICVGLMRTGLKTLRKALSKVGYTDFYDQEDIVLSYDLWDNVLHNRVTAETYPAIFQGAQVVMGMPTFCLWEQIMQRYPGARVILTVRDEDEWWQSVRRAKAFMDEEVPGAPLRYGSTMRYLERLLVPSYHKFCEILRFAWAATLGAHALEGHELNEAATRGCFRKHNTYVEAMLGHRLTACGAPQLLIYNVRDGWAPLCKFLDKKVPSEEFPSVMNVPYIVGNASTSTVDAAVPDLGQEFEELFVPDSEFGMRMRRELRRGLAVALVGLTIIAGALLAVHLTHLAELPVLVFTLIYLAVLAGGWSAYAIMHTLVMRVPALVVLPMAMKSLLIAACLQGCFITYGILKEMIVTQDQVASPVLVLSSRLMSVACGSVVLLITQGNISLGDVPLRSFFAFALTNEGSTWAGYEMLRYVSFPVQVMAKCCTLLPNMIMGQVLNGARYQWWQYVQAIGAMVCVTIMHLSDEGTDGKKRTTGRHEIGESSESMRMVIGVGLLVIYFACDSFTSQWQTAVYRKHPKITQTQMMVAGNMVGLSISIVTAAARWTVVSESLAYASSRPEVIGRILLLGLCGAMGQFCIYTAIKVLGALSFTWIMTSRQLVSVLLSLVMFGHGVSLTKLMCIFTVFAIMSSKQLSRAVPQVMRQCSGCRVRTGRAKCD